jgi:hypothetical protein
VRRNPCRPHRYVSCSRLRWPVCSPHCHPGKRYLSTGCRPREWPGSGSVRHGRVAGGYRFSCRPFITRLRSGGSHATVAYSGSSLARSWSTANVPPACHGICGSETAGRENGLVLAQFDTEELGRAVGFFFNHGESPLSWALCVTGESRSDAGQIAPVQERRHSHRGSELRLRRIPSARPRASYRKMYGFRRRGRATRPGIACSKSP